MFEFLTTADWPIYCLLSSLCLSFYFSVSKLFSHHINPFLYGFFVNMSGFVLAIFLFLFVYGDVSLFKISPVYIGLPVMMGVAFVLVDLGFIKSYAAGYKVSFVVPFVRTMLIFTLVLVGVFFLGESLSALNVFGLLLSVLGIKFIYGD